MGNFTSSAAAGYFIPEFMHTMTSTTLSGLRIPSKFFEENMAEGHQDDTVTLISDQLACPWEVSLEGQTLRDGLHEFARALKLKVSDSLVFTYKGNYVFKVTAFGANGEKLEHEYWEQDEDAIDAGNTSSGKGKDKQVVKEHEGQSARSQRNAAHVGENFGRSARSKRSATDSRHAFANSSPTRRDIRSHKNVAVEDITSFHEIVTESNIERNEMYLPKRFVELNDLDAKHIGSITLTNNDGDTWKAVVKVCCDRRMKIGGCWIMFCHENGIAAGDYCKFKLVENTDNIIIKLVGLNEDEEVEEVFTAARVQSDSSSGFKFPSVEGASMYSTAPGRGQSGQMQRM